MSIDIDERDDLDDLDDGVWVKTADRRHRAFVDDAGLRCVELARVRKSYGTIRFDPRRPMRQRYVVEPADGAGGPVACLGDAIRLLIHAAGVTSGADGWPVWPIHDWLNSFAALEELR